MFSNWAGENEEIVALLAGQEFHSSETARLNFKSARARLILAKKKVGTFFLLTPQTSALINPFRGKIQTLELD